MSNDEEDNLDDLLGDGWSDDESPPKTNLTSNLSQKVGSKSNLMDELFGSTDSALAAPETKTSPLRKGETPIINTESPRKPKSEPFSEPRINPRPAASLPVKSKPKKVEFKEDDDIIPDESPKPSTTPNISTNTGYSPSNNVPDRRRGGKSSNIIDPLGFFSENTGDSSPTSSPKRPVAKIEKPADLSKPKILEDHSSPVKNQAQPEFVDLSISRKAKSNLNSPIKDVQEPSHICKENELKKELKQKTSEIIDLETTVKDQSYKITDLEATVHRLTQENNNLEISIKKTDERHTQEILNLQSYYKDEIQALQDLQKMKDQRYLEETEELQKRTKVSIQRVEDEANRRESAHADLLAAVQRSWQDAAVEMREWYKNLIHEMYQPIMNEMKDLRASKPGKFH